MSFEWTMKISRAENGYVLTTNEDDCTVTTLIQDVVKSEDGTECVDQHEVEQRTVMNVMLAVMDYFGVYNSKHNKTRLNIDVEVQNNGN
jgi:hypothetical protein